MNDLCINIVGTMMSLIQNNAVKVIGLVLKQMCVSIQGLYCCKNIIFLIFIGTSSH